MQTITTNSAPKAIGPYSQAVDTGSAVYISGQIGVDPASGKLAQTFEEQAHLCLKNLSAVLAAAGLSLNNVAQVDIFMTDMAKFSVLNDCYAKFFTGYKPARLAVEVNKLPGGALVEMRCVAVR